MLGSGSRGNCSVLDLSAGPLGLAPPHEAAPTTAPISPLNTGPLVLLDLGLSPRETERRLRELGRSLDEVGAALVTHLDRDHCHEGWCDASSLGHHVEVFVHRRHLARAQRHGLLAGRVLTFDAPFRTLAGLEVDPLVQFHDELGVAAFRLRVAHAGPTGGTLGYATDLGRVTDELIEHMRGVDVLAIESNYCPKLQAASDRPAFLKRRITGGRGHLSNHEALEAIQAVAPREHVVLLHLSQQCNDPGLVASMHEGCDYTLTISSQDDPTRWVELRASEFRHAHLRGHVVVCTARRSASRSASRVPSLFDAPALAETGPVGDTAAG